MEYMLVRQNRVPSDAVEERLKHAPAPGDHVRIFLCLSLFDRILADALLGGYGRDNERRVEPSKAVPERLELGIPVPCSCVL